MYDVYKNKHDPMKRIATLSRAGLPDEVNPEDWELMLAGTYPIIEDTDEYLEACEFYFFTHVEKPTPLISTEPKG